MNTLRNTFFQQDIYDVTKNNVNNFNKIKIKSVSLFKNIYQHNTFLKEKKHLPKRKCVKLTLNFFHDLFIFLNIYYLKD